MKLFKEFLGEAAQPEWRVSFKKQKMNGVAIDEKPVTVKARDSREAIVKAAKKVGVSDKSAAMQLKTKNVDKLDESLTEALKIKIGDKVKSKNTFASTNNVKGEVVDIKTVKFASGDQTRYVVKEPDGYKIELRADDIIKEGLTEAKYEVEVEVRDARAANDLAKDMFRGSYKNDGSNVFIFKNEDDYEDFKYELENAGLKLMEQTQVNEAVSIDPEFMKMSKMLSDVKNTFKDVARKVKADTDIPVRQYQSTVDNIEDSIERLRKELDKAQTILKKA
jgi:ribosomal protein S8E